jgi:sugar lactone lactonase YvrE
MEVLHPELSGPETLVTGPDGAMYTGTSDGNIYRLAAGEGPQLIANTGGYPAGLVVLNDGTIVVADVQRGLVSISPQKTVRVVARGYGGRDFIFLNGAALTPDGNVLFTESSSRRPGTENVYELLEHRPLGNLYLYDVKAGNVSLVAADFYFANGVVSSRDGSYALVTEFNAYRITKVYLDGARRGEKEVLISGLPGFPDNLSLDPNQEVYWVGLTLPRIKSIDGGASQPLVRRMLSHLPLKFFDAKITAAQVVAIDPKGTVIDFLDKEDAPFPAISGALAKDGFLYLSSAFGKGIGRIKIPAKLTESKSDKALPN